MADVPARRARNGNVALMRAAGKRTTHTHTHDQESRESKWIMPQQFDIVYMDDDHSLNELTE